MKESQRYLSSEQDFFLIILLLWDSQYLFLIDSSFILFPCLWILSSNRTAFSIFCQDQIKLQGKNLLVGRSNKMDQLQDISQKWFDLPDSEREVYKQKLQQNLIKYSNELREWFEVILSLLLSSFCSIFAVSVNFFACFVLQKLCPSAKEDFLFCYPEVRIYKNLRNCL